MSLRWVAAFLSSEKYLSAFFFSFRLALMTMIVSTILGTAAALFGYRSEADLRAAGADEYWSFFGDTAWD